MLNASSSGRRNVTLRNRGGRTEHTSRCSRAARTASAALRNARGIAPAMTVGNITPAAVTATVRHPYVTITSPRAGQTGVSVTHAVSADVALFNGGINAATVSSSTVYLYRTRDGLRIPAWVNTSGAGDAIALTPKSPLAPYTGYTFVVTAGVRDVAASRSCQTSLVHHRQSARLSGGTAGGFDHVALPAAQGRQFFSLAMGPDGKLYAGTADGLILRYAIKSDGTLGSPQVIDSIRRANGGARFIVGLAFQPGCTATQPVLWVSHSATSSLDLGGTAGPDFTGKITRLTGANLETVHDAVIHLPRSVRDHVTDQPVFGPDGALYVCQPSNSSMGTADPIWGKRPEHLLNAAILRLDLAKLGGGDGGRAARRTPAARTTRTPPAPADDLRHRRAQRLRPRLAQQRAALRTHQRLGRRRQHAGRPRRTGPHQRQQARNRLPLPHRPRRLLRPPQPRPSRVRVERRQPHRRHRSLRSDRLPGGDPARPELAARRLRLRPAPARPTA